jgi:hypothetical protein
MIPAQRADAFYVTDQIPVEWREKLVKHELIEVFAARLFHLAALA